MIDARGMEVECLYGLYCCVKRIMFDEIRLHYQEPWMLTAYIGIFAKRDGGCHKRKTRTRF